MFINRGMDEKWFIHKYNITYYKEKWNLQMDGGNWRHLFWMRSLGFRKTTALCLPHMWILTSNVCCGYLTWGPNGGQETKKGTFSMGKGQIKGEKIREYRQNKSRCRILGAERLTLASVMTSIIPMIHIYYIVCCAYSHNKEIPIFYI